MSGPLDDVIPPTHKHRTLVVCLDGTGGQFGADVSGGHLNCALLNIYPLPPELERHQTPLHGEKR